MFRKLMFVTVLAVWVLGGGCPENQEKEPVAGDKPAAVPGGQPGTASVSLARDLMPVFERSCGVCHKREGGNKAAVARQAYFETKADIMGKVGKSILPGQPEKSGLLKVCNQSVPVGEDMIVMPPPDTNVPKWGKEELSAFSSWIADGAKDN